MSRAQQAAPSSSEGGLDPLVRRAREGEDGAFDDLVRELYPRLRRWALAVTDSSDDVDEVVQRSLIRAYESLTGFDGRARFTTWLYRIVRNVAVDLHRARGARERGKDHLARNGLSTRGADRGPGDAVADARAAAIVTRFFDDLPSRQREAVELVDLEGYEPSEAAAMMGVAPSTARVHLHRGRRALRERVLESHPHLEEEYGR